MASMDWLVPLMGAGGAFAVLGSLVAVVIGANRADRRDYRAAVKVANEEAGAWRARYSKLQDDMDKERQKRRDLEDRYETQIDALKQAYFDATGRYPPP